MGKLIARCYLDNCRPNFSLPRKVLPNCDFIETRSVAPLTDSVKDIHDKAKYCLDLINSPIKNAIQIFHSILYGIHLVSSCSIKETSFDIYGSGLLRPIINIDNLWGHQDPNLDDEAISFTSRYFDIIYKYIMPDQFNRVANSMRLHREGIRVLNSDLALLGFMGSLESLFSLSPQELSFRLSVMVAKFLGEDCTSQKEVFNRVKNLYKIRSKISHGDKIADSEEDAAISIVEHWTPEAEQLSRACLKQMLIDSLSDIFESKNKFGLFQTELIFSNDRAMATSKLRNTNNKQ